MSSIHLQYSWQNYYSTEGGLWSSMTSLILILLVETYLMIQLFRKICRYNSNSKNNIQNNKRISSKQTTLINPNIKVFVILFLMLTWISIIGYLSCRIYIVFFGGNLFCWIPDYPFILHIFGRLCLGWMFLTLYVQYQLLFCTLITFIYNKYI